LPCELITGLFSSSLSSVASLIITHI
jgi:hypothetical protein